ncbi:MAG TPA: hypothetical protein VE378_06010 [Nitrososphaeraceae archaeon]|nr:hypothetical protein [Nitrososphaeraceae archaeon]
MVLILGLCKPVELELWHSYNSGIGADTEHGQPITAPCGNGTIAFTGNIKLTSYHLSSSCQITK